MRQLTPQQIRFLTIRTIANFLILGSLFTAFLIFGPFLKNELVYRFEKWQGIKYQVVDDQKLTAVTDQETKSASFSDIAVKNTQVRSLTPVDADFGIVIPKIAANSKVIANVNAADYQTYMEALKIGVAHALGTSLPGEGGNIYLFAHSTDNIWNVGRYNAIFYLLKELEKGDEINLFYQGVRYIYFVESKEIVEPSAIDFLLKPSFEEKLTLQTCWPPGTTLKRLIVIAKPQK